MSKRAAHVPGAVRFDHRESGLGVASAAPRLSWAPTVGGATGYEIEAVAADGRRWTEAVSADAHLAASWVGPDLSSREERTVRVRALLPDGPGAWSEPTVAEAGLLRRSDWTARLVEADEQPGETGKAGWGRPVFRRRFTIPAGARRARLHVTYHGIGVLRLNGNRVGDEVLAPGWQSYTHRLAISVYDVTELLVPGDNVIEAEVGDGWFAGRIGFFYQRAAYGDTVGLIAQLEIDDEDGGRQVVVTDDAWTWRGGPTLAADIYDGETHDSRLELSADDDLARPEAWSAVAARPLPDVELLPSDSPPVRAHEAIAPERIITTPSGKTVVDFGQNIAGWVRLTADGPAGTQITVRHAEVLEHGELGVAPLRAAEATDRWILAGVGTETWEPSFTYHGFRYAEIDGWPAGSVDPDAVRAVAVYSDLPRRGWFETGHAKLARLHENVVWSMKGNFVSVPTDCPQRDERLGWTGDIAIFAPIAGYLYDSTGFLESWLRDVAFEQYPDGAIPYFVPELPFPEEAQKIHGGFVHQATAVWGDCATLVPFAVYDATGDVEVLRRAWPTMRRWVDAVAALAGPERVWDSGYQYGDWLDPSAPNDDPANGETDPYLIATAYFAHSAGLAARAAALIGEPAEAKRFARLSDAALAGFRGRYVREDGGLTSDSQTAYAVALQLDLLTGDERAFAARRLVELVRGSGHRIATGFVGTPLILHALTAVGAIDDAYALLLQEQVPSWLYAVGMGATTVWERWDSMLPDGTINGSGMTSFNHYSLGAVASWLHATVAGLSSLEPGWGRLRIAPRPHPEIGWAATAHETPNGRAEVRWELDGGILRVEATVPPATSAVLDIEGAEPVELGPGRHVFSHPWAPEVRRGAEEGAVR